MRDQIPDLSTRPRGNGLSPSGALLLAASVLALGLAGRAAWTARVDLRRAEQTLDLTQRQGGAVSDRSTRPERGPGRPTDRLVVPLLLTLDAPPPRVVADLTSLLPEDVRLERLSLEYGQQLSVDMAVVARNASAYDRLIDRLADSPRFADLAPGTELREGEVRSTLLMTYRVGAGR